MGGTQIKRAFLLFQALQRQGVLPSETTYNTLVSSCEKGKHPQRAAEVLEAMRRQDV